MAGSSQLQWVIGATDNASKVLAGIGKEAGKTSSSFDKMSSAAGTGLGKLSSVLGGEVGHLVHTFGAGLEELGEHGMSMGKKFMAAGGMVAGLGTGLMLMGSADKQASDQLAQAIGNTGEAFSQFKEEVEVAIHAQENYGHSAVDTQEALRKMTQATDDPKKALDMLGLAANLAAAQHITLSEAADKLDKILAGKGGRTLALYGIAASKTGDSVKDAEINIDALSKKIDGQADASVDNFAAKFTILRVKVTDAAAVFGNTFGGALTAAGGAATLLGTILEFRVIAAQRNAAIAATETAAATAAAALEETIATEEAATAREVAAATAGEAMVASFEAEATASTVAKDTELANIAEVASARTAAATEGGAASSVGGAASAAGATGLLTGASALAPILAGIAIIGTAAYMAWQWLPGFFENAKNGVMGYVLGLVGLGSTADAAASSENSAAKAAETHTKAIEAQGKAAFDWTPALKAYYAVIADGTDESNRGRARDAAAGVYRTSTEIATAAALAATAHAAHLAAAAHAANVAVAQAALATWNATITAYTSAKDALKALTDARANEIKAIGDQLTASGHLNSVFDMNAYATASDKAAQARLGLADAEKAVRDARSDVGKAKTPEELNAAINAEAQANKALAASRAEVAAADKAKEAAKLTPGHLLSSIKSKLSNIKSFYNDLVALRKRKLPMSLIRQLIDAGPLEGDQLAKALLAATPADFNAIVNAEAQLDAFGAKIGGIVGDYDYNGLIARQNGVVATARANAVAAGNQVAQFRLYLDGREVAVALKAYRASVGGAPLGLG